MYMKFSIDPAEKKVKCNLFYEPDKHLFDFEPSQAVELTLIYNYLQLCIDSESMLAKQLDGFNPYESWIAKKLTPPKAREGGLRIEGAEESAETPWVAIRMTEDYEWPAYYDSESGWVCLGDLTNNDIDQAVEFADGVIAVLKDGAIKSFWLKPIFKQEVPQQ